MTASQKSDPPAMAIVRAEVANLIYAQRTPLRMSHKACVDPGLYSPWRCPYRHNVGPLGQEHAGSSQPRARIGRKRSKSSGAGACHRYRWAAWSFESQFPALFLSLGDSGISRVGEKPSSVGARTACASAFRRKSNSKPATPSCSRTATVTVAQPHSAERP